MRLLIVGFLTRRGFVKVDPHVFATGVRGGATREEGQKRKSLEAAHPQGVCFIAGDGPASAQRRYWSLDRTFWMSSHHIGVVCTVFPIWYQYTGVVACCTCHARW